MSLLGDTVTEEPVNTREPAMPRALARLGVDRLLVLLAGICAIGFGTLQIFLSYTNYNNNAFGPFLPNNNGAVFTFAIALVFGVFLLIAFAIMAQKANEGSLVALAFSIVLLFFGGTAGTIGGILGLVGGLAGLLRGLKLVNG